MRSPAAGAARSRAFGFCTLTGPIDGDRHAGGRQTAKSTSSNRPGLRSFRVLRFRRLTSNVTQ